MIKNTLLENLSAPIVVVTHMRSGTHLTIDLLRRQFKSVGSWKWPGEANDSTYLALDVMDDLEANWGEKRAIRILKRCDRPIFKLHWTDPSLNSIYQKQPELAGWIESNGCFIYVTRHPLKVMASVWALNASMSQTHLELNEIPLEWLEQKMEYWKYHQSIWAERSGCHLLRYEDIVSKPEEILHKVSSWIGEPPLIRQPVLPPKLKSFRHSRWNRLTQFQPQSTEILTRIAAESIEERFGNKELEVMERVAGDLLRKQGYQL